MKTEQLIELQEEIEERKTQKAQLEGEKNAIVKQLKEDWNCKSIKQVEALIKEKEDAVAKLEEELEEGLEELEKLLR